MSLFDTVAGTADHLAGSTDEAFARSVDDTEGGGLWDGFTGVLDHSAGSVDESVARQFDDEEGGGFADAFVGDSRDDFVLREGTTERTIYDTLFDYEGEWGGSEDTRDIWGPSFDPRDVGDTDGSIGGTGIDWRNQGDNASEDPTNPDNWPVPPKWVAAFVVLLVVLSVSGPALNFGAAVADGGGS